MDRAHFSYGGGHRDTTTTATAAAPSTKTQLVNCTLTVEPGEVVAVVGSLGSGKSSLIRALLGEMDLVAADDGDGGKARVYGSVAYVSQTAWVPNEAFR